MQDKIKQNNLGHCVTTKNISNLRTENLSRKSKDFKT